VPHDGAFPHPDYRKAAPHHLREFAHMVGVLSEDLAADAGDEPKSGKDAAAGD
jgi:hypothetical protein